MKTGISPPAHWPMRWESHIWILLKDF